MIAAEAKRRGHDLVLGPTVNLVRDPRGGRTFESYGEDPRVLSDFGVAWIRALQGAGLIADVKHYAANNQETGRFTVDEIIDERTLREIYLPHFEAAVRRGHVGTVMTAYNKVNGFYMGANRPLLRGTLFGSFGFDGFVLSDFYAGGDTVGSALAGQSLALPKPQYYEPALLRAAIAEGRLTTATIDDLVRRYLRVLFRFGVFDRAAYPRDATIPVKRHGRVARLVEDRGIVLLRNRGSLLPLNARRIDSVAVIGKSADVYQRPNAVSSGGVSALLLGHSPPGPAPGRARALRRALRRRQRPPARRPRLPAAPTWRSWRPRPTSLSGEFSDRPCIDLDCAPEPPLQDRLIRAVAAANPRTVVVLQSPGPVTMPWVRRVGAIVEAWWPGQEGGNAIADVLLGKVNPSGKLPVTYPRALTDVPARTKGSSPAWTAARSTRRACWWATAGTTGAGSSRCSRSAMASPTRASTTATSRCASCAAARPAAWARVRVSLRVANVGPRSGAEVVQIYLGLPRPVPGMVQPPKALKRFKRRGDPERPQPRPDLRARGPRLLVLGRKTNRWRVAPGCYRVLVGSSSRDIRLRDVLARRGAGCAAPSPSTVSLSYCTVVPG